MPSIRNYIDFYVDTVLGETRVIELIKRIKRRPPPYHYLYVIDEAGTPVGVIDFYNPYTGNNGDLFNTPRTARVYDIMREIRVNERVLPSTRLKKAAKVIYEGELPGAPVVRQREGSSILGEVNRFGLLRAYQYLAPEDETVAELMREPINVFSRHDPVTEVLAWLRLQPSYQRFAIIVEEEGSYDSPPLGIVSMENLLSCDFAFRSGDRPILTAEDVMMKPLTVGIDARARMVVSMMSLYRTHIVSVIDRDGSLAGIVTTDDILVKLEK